MTVDNKLSPQDIEQIQHENDANARRVLLHGVTSGGEYVPLLLNSDGSLGIDQDFIKLDGTSTTTAQIPFAEGLIVSPSKLVELHGQGGGFGSPSPSFIRFVDSSTSTTMSEIYHSSQGMIAPYGGLTISSYDANLWLAPGGGFNAGVIVQDGTTIVPDSCDFGFGSGFGSNPDWYFEYVAGTLRLNANKGLGYGTTSFEFNQSKVDVDFKVNATTYTIISVDAGNNQATITGNTIFNNPGQVAINFGDADSGLQASGTGEVSTVINGSEMLNIFSSYTGINNNFRAKFVPTGTTYDTATFAINPASAVATTYLLWAGVNNVNYFSIDQGGNVRMTSVVAQGTVEGDTLLANSLTIEDDVAFNFLSDGFVTVSSNVISSVNLYGSNNTWTGTNTFNNDVSIVSDDDSTAFYLKGDSVGVFASRSSAMLVDGKVSFDSGHDVENQTNIYSFNLHRSDGGFAYMGIFDSKGGNYGFFFGATGGTDGEIWAYQGWDESSGAYPLVIYGGYGANQILKIDKDSMYLGSSGAKTAGDYTMTFTGSVTGIIKYWEDEGYFDFNVPIKLPYLGAAPSTLVNGMIWMESDGLHIYYAGAEKVVAGV